ncbi:MAG: DUF2784 domain-containing protein [Desulfobacteraceae bacterium]|nr:DUF2784 domain-containing protein [Desulfobacteraceae bacterium]
MAFRIMADLTLIVHFFWILFLILGFVFALTRSKIALLHMAGLLFTLILNLVGWYCPLTYLENYLYALNDPRSAYTGSFIINYLQHIIYLDLPGQYIRIVGISFAVLSIGIYVYLIKRYHMLDRVLGRESSY